MSDELIRLDCAVPIWDRFYVARPLVIIGTVDPSGAVDLAPKHLAGPVSWENLFGFVCCEQHATYRNAVRTGAFTVSYPTPEQIGADRLANAVAAYDRVGAPCIVIDFGTAVTFDVIGAPGCYLGGAIAPGGASMTRNLSKRTALLP